MTDCPLIGSWRLVAWYNIDAGGRREDPFGPAPTGYICYMPEGVMMVHMSAPDRRPFAANDPMGGTPEECAAALRSVIAYAGSWSWHDGEVVHHVTDATCPNWVGSAQRRRVRIDGDRLELSVAGIVVGGRPVTAFVEWQRIAPGN